MTVTKYSSEWPVDFPSESIAWPTSLGICTCTARPRNDASSEKPNIHLCASTTGMIRRSHDPPRSGLMWARGGG
jgi:hypothetical protein